MSTQKIAVGFFGVSRSLDLTAASIKENILDPLRMIGNLKVFAHLYDKKEIVNTRTGENNLVKPQNYSLLECDELVLEEPNICLGRLNYHEILDYGDFWRDGGQSLSNMLHQLNSLNALSELIKPYEPDVIVLVRPDMMYHDDFSSVVKKHFNLKSCCISVPNWGWSGGVNDRFAVCGRDAFMAYSQRVKLIPDFLELNSKRLWPEQFLFYCLNKERIKIVPVGLRANRIRSNGHVEHESFARSSFYTRSKRMLINRSGFHLNKFREVSF